MKLEDMQKLIDGTRLDSPLLGLLPKLLEVAKAAKNEALGWNEELCSGGEYNERSAAWDAFYNALEELEKE